MVVSPYGRDLSGHRDDQQMNPESDFEVYAEPREVALDAVGTRGLTVLLCVGIVNPMGPTLVVLAVDGHFEDDARLPVIIIRLNPFTQSCSVVGQVLVGDSFDPVDDAVTFFPSMGLQACPTLLLPAVWLDHDTTVALHALYVTQFNDGLRTLAQVKKFPRDPFARVQAEIDGAAPGLLSRLFGGGSKQPVVGRLDPRQGAELASLLLPEDSARVELQAFLHAWSGSIEFQRRNGSPIPAMPLPGFIQFLARLGLSCRLPGRG